MAAINVAAADVTTAVVEHAMQLFGAPGLPDNTVVAPAYAYAREIGIADGPNEVHRRRTARWELRRGLDRAEAAASVR